MANRNVERVARVLETLSAEVTIRVLGASTRTAVDAAAALGCEVGAIANSLIFMAGPTPVLIMTSGAHRVDLDLVSDAIGVPRLRRATPDEVRAATGQPIGAVAPVGHPRPIRTLVDDNLAGYETIWAAAGTPHAVFETTYPQLLAITGGRAIRVSTE